MACHQVADEGIIIIAVEHSIKRGRYSRVATEVSRPGFNELVTQIPLLLSILLPAESILGPKSLPDL